MPINMTKKEYTKYVEGKAPKTKWVQNLVKAFCSGGAVCTLGQGIYELLGKCGVNDKNAALISSVSLIFLASALTALHLFDSIAKHAGAGTLVPITGFANAMTSPAMEYRSEGLVAGMAVSMFKIAGPVIVYGLCSSVLYGIILVIIRACR